MARPNLRVALRAMRETLWPSRAVYLKSAGVCTTCNESLEFVAMGSWLRDELLCRNCGSIPRERALMWVIQEFFPGWRDFSIHESSPGGRGASLRLKGCTANVPAMWVPTFLRSSALGTFTQRDGETRVSRNRHSQIAASTWW